MCEVRGEYNMSNIFRSSVVINTFIKLFKSINIYWKNSCIYQTIKRISKVWNKAVQSSVINRFFIKMSNDEKLWKNSYLFYMISYPFVKIGKGLNKHSNIINNVFNQGLTITYIRNFIKNLIGMSSKIIGIFIFTALITEGILLAVFKHSTSMELIILRIMLLVAAVIFIFVDKPLISLFNGSLLFEKVKKICINTED